MRYISLQLVCAIVLTAYATHAQNLTSADDYSQRGIARFEKNDLEGAILDFTKAIEMNGRQLEFCHYFRGIALYRLNRLDEALADLTKAITLKQHPRFYDDRGNLLAQKGDLVAALADLTKAIEIESKYAKAYGDRAIVHLMRGESESAEWDFKKCFELDKTLEAQFRSAASRIKQQAVLRSEHQKPSDVEVLKFSWSESPSQVLVPPSGAPISVPARPVSQSGTRILGDPSAKDQSGPPPLLDSSSTPLPTSRGLNTSVQVVNYKFNISIKNTGNKTIAAVHWSYILQPKESGDALVYVFTTKVNIEPGKEKSLSDQVSSRSVPKSQSKVPTSYNRELFSERVVVLRLDYADGSSWKSAR